MSNFQKKNLQELCKTTKQTDKPSLYLSLIIYLFENSQIKKNTFKNVN